MRLSVLNVSYSLGRVAPETAGGAEHILLTLDRYLSGNGHRSLVIAPKGSRCHGLLLPTPPIAHNLAAEATVRARTHHGVAIRRALERFPVDVVHLHGVDFFDYLPRTNVPTVVTLHLPLRWYPPQALRLAPPSVYLVCVSRSQRSEAGGTRTNARVIANGVLWGECAHPRRKGNYVLSLGRICPEKGVHLAMDAATAASIPLYLAGDVAGYPEHRSYFEQEIRPRLQGGHRYLGKVSGAHKLDLLAGARAVLVPSLVPETSSLVAMEAMGCGTPVIAYPKGALQEIVQHGHTGYLVNNVTEMTEAILAIGGIDARRCIHESRLRFAAERMVSNYMELYKEAIRSRSITAPMYHAAA